MMLLRNQPDSRTEMRIPSVRAARIPRTETASRADVISVREIIVTTVMEMAADLAREDHRAARDVSEEKTEITVVKDALADRTTRVDSAPAVQEEAAADLTQSLHQS